jgi:mannose-6-phosphate isomerase-like protein (cupin superfamily)
MEMKGYIVHIEKETRKNTDFRHVLYTAKHSQLVLMSLRAKEEIGMETHKDKDQFFRFEAGEGKVVIDGVEHPVRDGDAAIVPAGAKHNVINTSASSELRLYTIYSPPEHQDGTIRHTKAEAIAKEEEFDGRTTERG